MLAAAAQAVPARSWRRWSVIAGNPSPDTGPDARVILYNFSTGAAPSRAPTRARARRGERDDEEPDHRGFDRIRDPAAHPRRALSGRIATPSGRPGGGVRRQPDPGAGGPVPARGRGPGADPPAPRGDGGPALARRRGRGPRTEGGPRTAAPGDVGPAADGGGFPAGRCPSGRVRRGPARQAPRRAGAPSTPTCTSCSTAGPTARAPSASSARCWPNATATRACSSRPDVAELERADREHREIVRLCRNGHVSAACALLIDHIGHVADRADGVPGRAARTPHEARVIV